MLVLGLAPLYLFGLGRWSQVWVGNCWLYVLRVQCSPFGGSAVGLICGTLGEGAGQSGWHTTTGMGRGALGAGVVGGLAVALEKMREGVWMAAN